MTTVLIPGDQLINPQPHVTFSIGSKEWYTGRGIPSRRVLWNVTVSSPHIPTPRRNCKKPLDGRSGRETRPYETCTGARHLELVQRRLKNARGWSIPACQNLWVLHGRPDADSQRPCQPRNGRFSSRPHCTNGCGCRRRYRRAPFAYDIHYLSTGGCTVAPQVALQDCNVASRPPHNHQPVHPHPRTQRPAAS